MCGQTHSQNSMTGEVAFGLVEWLSDVFAFRNSIQFSEGLKKNRQASQTQRWKCWTFGRSCHLCSMCCCRMTRPGPRRRRRRGRKSPRPEQ